MFVVPNFKLRANAVAVELFACMSSTQLVKYTPAINCLAVNCCIWIYQGDWTFAKVIMLHLDLASEDWCSSDWQYMPCGGSGSLH